jgi:hypothetical protein
MSRIIVGAGRALRCFGALCQKPALPYWQQLDSAASVRLLDCRTCRMWNYDCAASIALAVDLWEQDVLCIDPVDAQCHESRSSFQSAQIPIFCSAP